MVQIDRLFNEINPKLGEFTFDENVAHVFDDMISRSVPLYDDVQRVLPVLANLLDHLVIKSVAVRGYLGPLTVWVSNDD